MSSSGRPPGDVGETPLADEQLIRDLAAGREETMGLLYSRYAPIVFGMAKQAVDAATAEEIVQDVFLAVWRGASTYDSSMGPVRPWLLQIAHYRIANELRRRSRRPRTASGEEDERLTNLPDPSPDQTERLWKEHRREILRRALDELPPPQRQALGLAFFEELPHGQIASVLGVPLGTAKSRIRAGVLGLRGRLASAAAALVLLLLAAGVAARFAAKRAELARDDRALAMLTSSDSVSIRATASSGEPAAAHATYRFRPGSPIAVVTFSSFRAASPGEVDRAWALVGGRWILLGDAVPDAAGKARLVAESPALAGRPERIAVTRESGPAAAAPSGPTIVSWAADRE